VPKKFTGSDIRVRDVIFLAAFFLFLHSYVALVCWTNHLDQCDATHRRLGTE
jgi:hypothetical protein